MDHGAIAPTLKITANKTAATGRIQKGSGIERIRRVKNILTEPVLNVGGRDYGSSGGVDRGNRRFGTLQPAEQNQDQQHNDYETEAAATVITGAVKWAASVTAKSAKQYDDQKND
jgi:hypothetical protein